MHIQGHVEYSPRQITCGLLGHKASFGKFKNIEIKSSVFLHNTMRSETNYQEKTAKRDKHARLKNMLLNNQWITEEIKEEIKKY